MRDLFENHRVLICGGTGGVGKTTLSASLGLLAAQHGRKVLVLTIDPALRLAQSLGIENRPGEDVGVKGVAGLSASMIDPRREFDEFVLGSVDRGIAKELFENRLYKQLVSNLNGSQEFTSLLRLLKSVRDPKYDLIVLDTPPTQNAVDFLKAPERLYALFQDTVISWFARPSEDESLIKRAIHRGTRMVTTALESVTGSGFIGELKDFFNHVSHLRGRIADVSAETARILRAPTTGFVLVTGFDETKLREALDFQADLERENLRLTAVVVNRWFPEWAESGGRPFPAEWSRDADFQRLREFHEKFSEFFSCRAAAYERFTRQLDRGGGIPVLRLPDFKSTVQGVAELSMVAKVFGEQWRSHP